MFKAKIVTNINGKQTVLEFDNEKEYYDYLESHPELNQSLNWNWNNPWGLSLGSWNPWGEMDKLVDHAVGRHLGHHPHHPHHDQSPLGLVRQDMDRISYEEKRKEQEAKEEQRRKEQAKKDLEDARELLKTYTSKQGHNPEYAKKLEEHIKKLEAGN